jgi:hypothetical protein
MNDFAPLVALAALNYTLVQFLKQITAAFFKGLSPSWVTQLIAWAAGIATVLVAAQTQFAPGIQVGDYNLAHLSLWSQVFVGLTVSGVAGASFSFKRAIDNSDTDAIGTTPPAE